MGDIRWSSCLTQRQTNVNILPMLTEPYPVIDQVAVGQRISWLMKDRHVKPGVLAARVGVTLQGLGLWRRGERRVPGWAVASMAVALRTTADYILGLVDDPSPRDW